MIYAELQKKLAEIERTIAQLQDAGAGEAARLLVEALTNTLEELQLAEESLLERSQGLETANVIAITKRQRYQELFELAPDSYLVTDTHGRITEANARAELMLGEPASPPACTSCSP